MSQLHIAYLAGLFDGEGSIYMTGHTPASTITVTFTNTNRELCQLYVDIWGGSITHQLPKNSSRAKVVYRWYRQGQNALPFLKDIKPYLVAKLSLVELALEYLALKMGSGKSFTPKIIQKRLKISQAIFNSQQRQHLM